MILRKRRQQELLELILGPLSVARGKKKKNLILHIIPDVRNYKHLGQLAFHLSQPRPSFFLAYAKHCGLGHNLAKRLEQVMGSEN